MYWNCETGNAMDGYRLLDNVMVNRLLEKSGNGGSRKVIVLANHIV